LVNRLDDLFGPSFLYIHKDQTALDEEFVSKRSYSNLIVIFLQHYRLLCFVFLLSC